jgi:serine/threonine protein kinase
VIAHGMDEEELPVYDEKVDIWSVGALLFEALTGFQPFLADGAAEMAAAVAARLADRDPETGLPVFLSRQPALSADAKDFIARCLEARPEARPSAAELLAHPWLERRGSLGEALSQAVHPQPGQKTPMNRCLSEAAIAPATGHMADSDPGVVLGPLEGLHRSPLLRAGSDADLLHRSKAGPLADE